MGLCTYYTHTCHMQYGYVCHICPELALCTLLVLSLQAHVAPMMHHGNPGGLHVVERGYCADVRYMDKLQGTEAHNGMLEAATNTVSPQGL